MSWKHLFSRSLSADPDRLHFAAHSHHLWPDASFDGHMEAWSDAARLADHKWDRIMGPVLEEAQDHIARELNLRSGESVCFSPNTHDFLIRIFSAINEKPVRVLSTSGEFHSFRRQMARWVENGDAIWDQAGADELVIKAASGDYDLIFASHVQFNNGKILPDLTAIAALARPEGPWVVIDGYHAFMAVPTDIGPLSDRIFYLAGGYKYAMSGEGCCFLHAPPGFAPRPVITGWYAEFDDLALPPGSIGYAKNAARFFGSTFDPSGLYRFNHVRRMLTQAGLDTALISAHVAELQHQLVSTACPALESMTLLNPPTAAPRARFLAFQGKNAGTLHQYLEDHRVITDVRGDVIRIGFAIYHDSDDVERLADTIRRFDQR